MTERLPEIEGYRVLRLVGQGGLGRVFLAETVAKPHRQVALKLLRERIDFRVDDIRRLMREARVGKALHHPNILPVLAIEPWGETQLIVMAFVDGAPLAPWRREHEPPEALGERILALASIADALHFAHTHRVVHRDVKPANILVRRDGHPFLIDFGLARTVAVDSTVTATGTILGTPGYLPPEHVAGGTALDARGDVYSLGVTLHEIVSGALPFRASTLPELFDRILHAEPPRLPPGTPHAAALDPIIRRATEKRPQDRYPDAARMRDDLVRAARGLRPRRNASLWVRRELRRFARRRLQVAVGLAALVSVLALGLWRRWHDERSTRIFAANRQQGYDELERGELERALASFELLESGPSRYEACLARAEAFAEFQMWRRARSEIREAVARGYDFGQGAPSARNLLLRGLQQFGDGSYSESQSSLEAALALDPNEYRAYFVISRLLVAQGKREEAVAVLQTCRRNLKEINPRHAAVSSQIDLLSGNPGSAIRRLEALRADQATPRWLHALLGNTCLTAFHDGSGDPQHLEEAIEELSTAVELEPGDANSWASLGLARFLTQDIESARSCALTAVQIDAALTEGHRFLAILEAEVGNWSAVEQHLAALEREAPSDELLHALRSHRSYEAGLQRYVSGDYEGARAAFEACVLQLPDNLAGWFYLGQCCWLLDRREEAFEAHRKCRARMESWQPPRVGRAPWIQASEAVISTRSQEVDIGLLASAGVLERPLSNQELDVARAALEHLRPTRSSADSLGPESALNLAEALATTHIEELRDCPWALELVEAHGLIERFSDLPEGARTLDGILNACPP